jgi:hypothetical protein
MVLRTRLRADSKLRRALSRADRGLSIHLRACEAIQLADVRTILARGAAGDRGINGSLIRVIIGFIGRTAFARTVPRTGGDRVNPRIKATVVGSYPVPSWLVGNTSRLVLRDAVMSVLKT